MRSAKVVRVESKEWKCHESKGEDMRVKSEEYKGYEWRVRSAKVVRVSRVRSERGKSGNVKSVEG